MKSFNDTYRAFNQVRPTKMLEPELTGKAARGMIENLAWELNFFIQQTPSRDFNYLQLLNR